MRLFIAVRFSRELQDGLAEVLAELRRQGVRGTFTRPENLHLTLAFIGETTRLRDVHAAVGEVEVTPFPLQLGEPGRFRDLLWLGVRGEEPLRTLAGDLRKALAGRGIPFDEKPFKAHITLVRRASETELPGLTVPPAGMTVTRLAVMESARVEGVLTYREV